MILVGFVISRVAPVGGEKGEVNKDRGTEINNKKMETSGKKLYDIVLGNTEALSVPLRAFVCREGSETAILFNANILAFIRQFKGALIDSSDEISSTLGIKTCYWCAHEIHYRRIMFRRKTGTVFGCFQARCRVLIVLVFCSNGPVHSEVNGQNLSSSENK